MSCKDVIRSCDLALVEKDKTIELSDLANTHLKVQNSQLQDENKSLKDTSMKWYHSGLVMFILGIATGGLTYTLLKK